MSAFLNGPILQVVFKFKFYLFIKIFIIESITDIPDFPPLPPPPCSHRPNRGLGVLLENLQMSVSSRCFFLSWSIFPGGIYRSLLGGSQAGCCHCRLWVRIRAQNTNLQFLNLCYPVLNELQSNRSYFLSCTSHISKA